MSDRRRGSQPRKGTGGPKAAARGEHVDAAQIEAQLRRSFVLADRAIKHLRRCEAAKAVREAERAAKLQPDHDGIAEVYLDAAELARDKAVLARRVVEGPACAACGVATLRIYLCDDRLHPLCEGCGQTGKLDGARCAACSGARPDRPVVVLDDATSRLRIGPMPETV